VNLQLENVSLALADFELRVDAASSAEAIGIFGPSGAGKTTLLEIIVGLRRADGGRIIVRDRVLSDSERRVHLPARERHVGYVPQDETLFPHLSVRANALYGVGRRAADEVLFGDLSAILEIQPLLDRSVTGLSGGERRRIALARALMTSPAVLLLDEPLSGLDAALKERTLELLRNVRARFRTPMILVSHDHAEVRAFCDDVLVLDRGRVVAHGSPEAVL
jgi:molybdate transport system ATP-binding protein